MMITHIRILSAMLTMVMVTPLATAQSNRQSQPFKLHNIFGSGMVLQRDKPIKVWGWAKPGSKVKVTLGTESAEATTAATAPVDVFGYEEAYKGLGKWEVSFPARPASTDPITLTATTGGETITLDNVLLGDVWVMSGQSNMGFGVSGTDVKHLLPQANIPLLRLFSIAGNEQASLQDDIRPEAIDTISKSWDVSSPETAAKFSAIGFAFAVDVQRSLGIPIGVIKNARGGASLESMVPAQKFDEHPLSKSYADSVRKRMAEFNPEALVDQEWAKLKEQAKAKGQPEPPRPQPKPLRSWNIPGKSPGDMASVHNGYFGVFKGYNIKGVVFHQGFNNTLGDNCRPKRYRLLIKLMVNGWREDFSDPKLPVCIIGGCGSSTPQNASNFEQLSVESGPFIREAQRLGLEDVGDPENTEFIPDYDVRIPELHPTKKRVHGQRAARWALSHIYQHPNASWTTPIVPKVEANGDMMMVRFAEKQQAQPDDRSDILEGFSVAGEDGKFYMAYGRYLPVKQKDKWGKDMQTIQVWSPMVEKPVALRYAWATAAMGNLKLNGDQDIPFPGFRTDQWDLPESEDPAVGSMSRGWWNERKADAQARFDARRLKEADMGRALFDRIDQMTTPKP